MNSAQPGPRPRRMTAALVGLASAAVLLAACSGSSGHITESTGQSTTVTTSSASSSASTASPTPAPTTTKPTPVAHCPVLARVKNPSPLRPLPCTSLTTLAASAKRIGLTTINNESSLIPNVKIRFYEQDSLKLPLREPWVVVFYTDNGAVVQARCTGLAGNPLNPVLKICADVGPSTRTDLARVQAWALRAEKTIDAKPATILRLSSGHLYFVACSDSTFKPHKAGFAYQMQLFAQVGPGEFSAAQCKS